jgi:hypothetical protein
MKPHMCSLYKNPWPSHESVGTYWACKIFSAPPPICIVLLRLTLSVHNISSLSRQIHQSRMSNKSYWARPRTDFEPEQRKSYNPAKTGCHRQGDRACSNCHLGYMVNDQSRSSNRIYEPRTQPAFRPDSERTSCQCTSDRPGSDCNFCKAHAPKSTSAFLRTMRRGREQYEKRAHAARQDQPGIRTRNPDGHVRPF